MKEEIEVNQELLNKVGKLLRRDGEYGKIIASKFKASELLMCIMYIYNVIGNMWI